MFAVLLVAGLALVSGAAREEPAGLPFKGEEWRAGRGGVVAGAAFAGGGWGMGRGGIAAGLAVQAGGWTLSSIAVNGADRFPEEAVLKAAGLSKGMKAGKAEMDGACQALVQTGLFQNCGYRWKPVSAVGIALEVTLREAPSEFTACLTVPGIEENRLWEWLSRNEPLATREMPGSDEAVRFYTAAVNRALRSLGNQTEVASILTEKNEVVFRPADLPSVVDVRFKGNVLFTERQLRHAIMTVASQAAYTEIDFRKLLDLNVRPLYEEKGRLGVQFAEITAEKADGGVVVTTSITEGPVYVLKSLEFSEEPPPGTKLPTGSIANWRAVLDSLEFVKQSLRNEGYLRAECEPERKLDDGPGHVHVKVTVRRGEQFRFGGLALEGLPSEVEQKVRSLWRLPVDAPLNDAYVGEFLRSAFQVVGKEYRAVSKEVGVRPGTRIVDIKAKFTP